METPFDAVAEQNSGRSEPLAANVRVWVVAVGVKAATVRGVGGRAGPLRAAPAVGPRDPETPPRTRAARGERRPQ